MWRNGSKASKGGGDKGGPQQLVAVAVGADKNSQHALRWAADHIISRGQIFLIIHVRKGISSIPTPHGQELPVSEVEDETVMAFQEQMDYQTRELLLPFQCFCSRRGMNCKEIILDDTNIAKAIVDYVQLHGIEKLVLGASSRNAFTRTFKSADVATSISKTAPEFCSVYVIAKGKILSARPATTTRTSYVDTLAATEISPAEAQFQSTKSETVVRNHNVQTPRRYAMMNNARKGLTNNGGSMWLNEQIGKEHYGGVGHGDRHLDFSYQSVASCPSPSRNSVDKHTGYVPKSFLNAANKPNYSYASTKSSTSEHDDLNDVGVDYEFTRTGGAYSPIYNRSGDCPSPWRGRGRLSDHSALNCNFDVYINSVIQEDVESELRRLKLELKYAADKNDDEACEMSDGVDSPFEEPQYSRERMFEKAEREKQSRPQTNSQVEIAKGIASERIMLHPLSEDFCSSARYRRYSIEEIQQATNDFSNERKIGEGGYGPVFKCTLDHTTVAVKIPRSDVAQGTKQFQQEVEVLSCIRHPNMVLLMGACPEYGCLVYEYMGNGSLEDRLFCLDGTPPLTWQLRFKMAAEIATGLLFLHQTKPEPIVHRDLKPANILLDESFVSKITDVGLARLIPSSTAAYSTRYVATVAAGTFCYIDPEYQKTGTVGVKSDTYALGIILLQMITARPPMGLTHVTENALEAGRLRDLLDPNVPDWPMDEAEALAKLALSCAELRRKDRPDLAAVVLPELNRLRDFALSATNRSFS